MQQNSFEIQEVLGESRSGKPLTLDKLLGAYGNYLHMLAQANVRRSLQSKIDAADLVQETALLAVRDFPQFRGGTEREFVGWLRSILSNVCAATARKFLKTQSRNTLIERQLQDGLDQSNDGLAQVLVDRNNSPSQSAARREAAVLVADALASLPEECRDVVIRHHLSGQTINDIGQDLGKSRHAIRRLLARAVVLLQAAVEELNE